MRPPIPLPPDGCATLAALIALRGPLGPISDALAATLAATPSDRPAERLAEACARRRHLGPPAPTPGRAPAARFCRRHHRRWRVQQSAASVDPARLARAGRRALRRDLGWADAAPEPIGAWLAFWAEDDPAIRWDLLASQPLSDARQIVATPVDRATAQRFWR